MAVWGDLSPLQAIQIGIFTEIVGFSSSFIGFYQARLIDFRMGLRTALVGIPAAVAGVLLAYRLDEAVLLFVVALAMPALAWYIRHPPQAKENEKNGRNRKLARTVKEGASRIPLCCYASANLYAGDDTPTPVTRAASGLATLEADEEHTLTEHRDSKGNTYRYGRPSPIGQGAVGAVGGTATGLLGFGVGVLGVAHLVISRIPIRIAVGTSHFVILIVTGVAVVMHLVEMSHSGITPPWNVIAVNATAVLFGGQLAAWLAGRAPEQRMRIVLTTLLVVLAVVTLYRAVRLGIA